MSHLIDNVSDTLAYKRIKSNGSYPHAEQAMSDSAQAFASMISINEHMTVDDEIRYHTEQAGVQALISIAISLNRIAGVMDRKEEREAEDRESDY